MTTTQRFLDPARRIIAFVRRWWCRLVLGGGCDPTVVLVRHADYVPSGSDPGLSPDGDARAHELVHVLGVAGVTHIVVSQFRRTQDTAAPLAAHFGLTPEVIDATDLDAVMSSISTRSSSEVVLVVGHSNTVPDLIGRLTPNEGPVIAGESFDNLFVVIKRRLAHLRYGAET